MKVSLGSAVKNTIIFMERDITGKCWLPRDSPSEVCWGPSEIADF